MEGLLPSFTVIPRKSFLGLDKSSAHCFTMRSALFSQYSEFFGLSILKKQVDLIFVDGSGEFPATIRFVNQNKSKPNKIGIQRDWPERHLLSVTWKGKGSTIRFFQQNLDRSVSEIKSGLRIGSQRVRFEHIGDIRFFVSFS